MKVEITSNAKDFLNKKEAKEITMDIVMVDAEFPMGEMNVKIGSPKHSQESYDKLEVDGYVVYFHEHDEMKDETVEIDTKHFLGMERLGIKGNRFFQIYGRH